MHATPKCYLRGCIHDPRVGGPDDDEVGEIIVCDAFPEGIPSAIAFGDDPHLYPVEGDHGIQFEGGAEVSE